MTEKEMLRREIHEAFDPIVPPAPHLASAIGQRLRAEAGPPSSRLRSVLQTGAVLVAAVLIGVVVFVVHRAREARAPVPPTVTSSPYAAGPVTSPGGQVGWLEGQQQGGQSLIYGIDPAGHLVGSIGATNVLRSPDGNDLYAISDATVQVYSALTGQLERKFAISGAPVASAALSPEGRFLGIVRQGNPAEVDLIDVTTGGAVGHASLAPSFGNGIAFLIVGARASHIYAFGDFWQPSNVVALTFDGTTLRAQASAQDRQQGHLVPYCNGMVPENATAGIPIRLLPDQRTIVSFCPGDGQVAWFDVDRLTITRTVLATERNPFWLSPVFAPDGSMLYLQEPGTGQIQAVDLQRRVIVGPVTVTSASSMNPFEWIAQRLFPVAYAGGIPRTAAISPDGTLLYLTGAFGQGTGVLAVHLPDLRAIGHWKINGGGSVWLSGDGQALYVVNEGGSAVSIVRPDGKLVAYLTLPGPGYDFLALPQK